MLVPVSTRTGSDASTALATRSPTKQVAFFMALLYTVYVQSTTMILRIDLKSPVPVYRQIVDCLRILLVNSELSPGDQLPPVRRLALDLGVHFNTVAEAYRTLEEEGWLEIGRRSGARVVARAVPKGPDPTTAEAF